MEYGNPIQKGVYKTSYGTLANYVTGANAWDIKYKQFTPISYLRERVRTAYRSEYPSYLNDRGRDEVVTKTWFDRTGKRKPRIL